MKPNKNLSEQEYQELLKFPAYISLLAANSDGKLDEAEKKSAIRFSHIKTYSCNPLLLDFYEEADKAFEQNIEQLDKELPKENKQRENIIKNELLSLEKLVLKSGEDYTLAMRRSMKSFKEHVSKAHRNVLVDFIFPVPINGLTD